MNDIKVSVSVITYKHARYIRQCLDSILSQKVDFKYQIVVGEDCSNDGTREILLEYQEKYPDIFVLLLNEQNMGAAKNNHNVKLHCQGQYIATCEGDDFWVDDQKLQKQVDFLEAHPEYVAVGSNSVSVDTDGNHPKKSMFFWQTNRSYCLDDYQKYGLIIHGSTLLHRNVIPYRTEKYVKLRLAEPTMGDVLTRVLLYDKGSIFVMPEVTHAHRSGADTPTSFSAQQKTKALMYTKMYFRIINNLTAYFDGKYDLEPLKANRMGAMLRDKYFCGSNMDKEEFREVWSGLTPRLKWLSVSRCIQKTVRWLFHGVVRRIIRK